MALFHNRVERFPNFLMRISTKLMLLLFFSVGVMMLGAGLVSLRQYEISLENALRDDLLAHAVTLRIALEEELEDDYAAGHLEDTQKLIDRLRANTEIYSVLLFDKDANLLAQSTPLTDESLRHPPELKDVLQTSQGKNLIRYVNERKFASIILPLKIGETTIGAVEIVKPLSLIEKDIYYARLYWLLTIFLLLAVIFTIVFFVLRRNLSEPIDYLLSATAAVSRGNFAHHVKIAERGDEIGRLAMHFNQMAESLEERRRAAREETENRLKLERELRHNEQLAAVGRLAAGVAHELGAPLNVIDARAEQILNKPDISPEKHDRNLQIIRSNVARITHLVRQLLNLARPFNLNLTNVNIKKSLARTIENIETNAQNANVEVDFSAPEDLYVRADAEYLQQVWTNILTNSLQELTMGGKIVIKIEPIVLDNESFAEIEIFDTGSGIPDEHFVCLFDPFFTTKDIGKGTGLGLPIAKRIIEEHGGKIKAGNQQSAGALFKIYLPISGEK